jgi:hypothetical protein
VYKVAFSWEKSHSAVLTPSAPIRKDEYQVSSGFAAQGMNGQCFVTGHDFSRAAIAAK